MNIPCPTNSPCIDDASAFGNYSSEEPDRELFRSTYFPNAIWDADFDIWVACFGLCASTISQAEADLCAQNNAKICEGEKMFANLEHTCYRTCPGGVLRSYTVPAGTFWDQSQSQANALAVQWCAQSLDQICADPTNPFIPPLPPPRTKPACNDQVTVEVPCFEGGKGIVFGPCKVWGSSKDAANEKARSVAGQLLDNNVGCLIEFVKSVCVDSPISRFIVPNRTGAFVPPLRWEVFGAVPSGLTFTPMGIAMQITGVFSLAGRFGFRLELIDSVGTYTYRNYIVEAMEIIEPSVLPNAQQDDAYSHTITVDHGWDPKTFAVRSDSVLPTGLTLNGVTGAIEGTPTGFGTSSFWIVVTDKYGAICEKEFTLTIDPNIFSSIAWNTLWQPDGAGVGIAQAAGEHVLLIATDPGGAIPSGGTSRANCAWNCFNPTANPLNCTIYITQTRVNGVPPNAPPGVQWGAIGLFYWARTDVPIVVANSAGLVAEGTYGPYAFTIPPGASSWVGSFITYVGSVNGVGPWPGGSATLEVQLNIV